MCGEKVGLPMWLKICGLTQPEQVVAIAAMGVSALGVIGVPKTPRYVTPETMGSLNQALRSTQTGIPMVAVVMDPEEVLVAELVEGWGLGGLQLHGQEPPEVCAQIRRCYPSLLLIKALRPRHQAELAQGEAYAPWVDFLLVDAYHPQQAGGTGQTGNWELLESWDPPCRWILAGGLNRITLPQALARLQPDGVDLSSGVETSPGIKNLGKVAEIVEIVTDRYTP